MKITKQPMTRRSMLGSALAAAGLQAFPLNATAGSDRVLVCIYLFGGNDSNNMLVPDQAYDLYAAARGPLALPKQSLLPVTSRFDQAVYGFHPALREVQGLFETGALSVVSNVGKLDAEPGFGRDVSVARRHATELIDSELSYFTPGVAVPKWAASVAGATEDARGSLFTGFPCLLPGTGKVTSMSLLAPEVMASKELRKKVLDVASAPDAGVSVTFPLTGLGQQLRQVAALIAASSALGFKHGQIYTVTLGGFATNTNQLPAQSELFRELSSAMGAFYQATLQMGRTQSVTTYTDSEHSRTLVPNAQRGSDPAWGAHHLAMGGAVIGSQVHGVFPSLIPGGPDDAGKRGSWIPSSSKDQYAATLANWFGVPPQDVNQHLPGVARTSRRTLGFLVTG